MTTAPTPALDAALAVLRRGGLVAIPTETVYGLGADATDEAAVRRVFAVKGRPVDHPLIVHVGSPAAIDRFAVDVPDSARRLAARFWPGPLTLVLWRATDVLDVVTGGLDTVALRMPDHPLTLALLAKLGGGIAAPSANRFGRVSPTEAAHVARDLGDDVDFILDGGACRVGVESTIVDLTAETPVLLRTGAISAEAIEETLGRPIERHARGPSRAPGMLRAHYAPSARVTIVPAGEARDRAAALAATGVRVGLLGMFGADAEPDADADTVTRTTAPGVSTYDLGRRGDDAARSLYAALRRADDDRIDELLVVLPPADDTTGVGLAIADRLRRAAAAFERDLDAPR